MTKRDSELIAQALRKAGVDRCVCCNIAFELQQVYPRFNTMRFLEACGPWHISFGEFKRNAE